LFLTSGVKRGMEFLTQKEKAYRSTNALGTHICLGKDEVALSQTEKEIELLNAARTEGDKLEQVVQSGK